ncbi:MAG: ferritin-like domain-containing protein [Actinomycetota bacterium]|nr:ferritin-like domain-containing protein [Actinomycetota bacterium]
MSTQRIYTLPTDQTEWKIHGSSEVVFNWEYDQFRDNLLTLYSKGKQRQWDSAVRIDWSQDVDPENPMELDDTYLAIYGSPIWDRMNDREKVEVRRHAQAWQISQFLHGEQGALICAAKIVETVPDVDSKFYAATQVMDEARHVETYARYLHDKLELAYPVAEPLKLLLIDIVSDSRWDFTYLGMQVLIEGLALAAFGLIRDLAQNPLASAINAYVMQDEARHVAFGRLALKEFYPQITQAERDEREDFVIQASYLMRDRFRGEQVWQRLGLPEDDCAEYVDNSALMQEFRKMLFTRIVPTIKDIGLWGEKVRRAYAEMGVIAYADADPSALSADDERFAEELDARRHQVAETIAAADEVSR